MQKTSIGEGNIGDYQGIQLDQIASMYGYNQITNEPTNIAIHHVLI